MTPQTSDQEDILDISDLDENAFNSTVDLLNVEQELDQAEAEEEPSDHQGNSDSSLEEGYIDPMAAALRGKLETLRNDVTIKTDVIRTYLARDPPTNSTKRQTNNHLGQMSQLVQEHKQMVSAYIDKLPPADKEEEQTRLNAITTQMEVALTDLQDEHNEKVSGDDAFRNAQYPMGASLYKSFSDKVQKERTELDKLNRDMRAEQGELPDRRAQLYIDTIARHKKILEKDLPALVPRILDSHGALTTEELNMIHGYDNLLSPLVQQATVTFTGLTLPASVNARITSTPDVSLILGPGTHTQNAQLASVSHHPLPGAAHMPPPGLGTAGGRVPGQGALYKPYKDHDYPTFRGLVEEYGGWKKEWQEKILPWMSQEIALRELNRCTPKSIDLSIYDSVDDIWRELGRLYGNPLTISSSIMDKFLELKPQDVEGETEELQLANLEKILYKLRKQLKQVDELQQLTESAASVKQVIKLLPRPFARVWAASPEAKETTREVAGLAEKRDVAKAQYEALATFIHETVDNLHTQSPWLLMPPPSKKDDKKGGKNQRNINAATTGRKDRPDDKPTDQARLKEKQTEYGPCPACGKGHTFKGRNGQTIASNRMSDCKKLTSKSPDQMVDFLTSNSSCTRCLSWLHVRADCPYDNFTCSVKEGGSVCGRDHNRLLHKSKKPAIINHTRTSAPEGDDILAPIVEVDLKGHKMVALLDPGSNTTIITHEAARKVKAKSKFVRERVKLAGRPEEIQETCLYTFSWKVAGKMTTIQALGMAEITDTYGPENVDSAYNIFPQYTKPQLDRPVGNKVDILIGLDNNQFLASGGQGEDQADNLCVMDTPLSASGKVLTGHHPSIRGGGPHLAPSAVAFRKAVFLDSANLTSSGTRSVNLIRCHALTAEMVETDPGIMEMEAIPDGDFLASEQIGVITPRTCGKCKECLQCVLHEDGPSVKQHLELQMMRKVMTHDPVHNRMRVSYPMVGDPSGYTVNYTQALSRARSLWASLKKRGLLDLYQENIKDYINRGVWKPTTWEDINTWRSQGGLVHFCAHNAVLNEASLSTKVRIVVDSAIRNPGNNLSINDLWAAGPSTLNPLFETLISFRSFEVGLVYDLSKAYHQLWTGETEFFARLCVWRHTEEDPWVLFGTNVVGMGDRPATPLLDLALTKAAEMSWDEDPKAAEQLARHRYADDTLGGGSKHEVEKMRGNITKEVKEDGSVTISTDGSISKILSTVSFKPKVIVISGDTDPDLLGKVDKVLGIKWLPTEDLLQYKFDANLGVKIRGKKVKGPTLEFKDIDKIRGHKFTRREALGISHQMYDPIGLTASYIMKMKVRIRELVLLNLDWDQEIPVQENQWWRDQVEEIIRANPICFPRSIWVKEAQGRPEILGFWDGSNVGFGCLVYVRWLTSPSDQEDTYNSILYSSKARVTPKVCTTPRAELAGLVLLARLLKKIIPSMDNKPCRLTIFGDSTCTISSMQLSVQGMRPFFANRVLEITTILRNLGCEADREVTQELTREERSDTEAQLKVDLIQHIAGIKNPADTPSRGTIEWKDMDQGSEYQKGPAFISTPRDQWSEHITRDFIKALPEEETRRQFHNVMLLKVKDITHVGVKSLVQIQFYSDDIKKVKGIMARLAKAARTGEIDMITTQPDPEDYEKAAYWLCLLARDDTADLLRSDTGKSLCPFVREGLYVTRGRLGTRAMSQSIGHTELIILSPKSRLAFLILTACHREDHRQSDQDALYRSRCMGYWIIRGKALSAKVTKSCILCKMIRLKAASQKMGKLPVEKTTRSDPFTHISLDIMAPVGVIQTVKARTQRQVYPIIFTCLTTTALHSEVAVSYSTTDFMTQFDKFCAIRGRPSWVYTDMGSQLVKAQSLHDCGGQGFRWKEIQEATSAHGIRWRHAPSGAQWRDATESQAKSLKHTMKHLTKSKVRTYPELQTLLAKAVDIIGQRPLGIAHHSGAEPGFTVLTPNSLIKNQRTAHFSPPDEELEASLQDRYTRRQREQADSLEDWWNIWYKHVFASLIPLRKWRTAERNVRVGDIALLMFKSKVSAGDYRLCRVSKVFEDQDEDTFEDNPLVRTCEVQVAPKAARAITYPSPAYKLTTMTVPVQRLCIFLPKEAQDSPHSETVIEDNTQDQVNTQANPDLALDPETSAPSASLDSALVSHAHPEDLEAVMSSETVHVDNSTGGYSPQDMQIHDSTQ